jgi:hypothetical protein
MIGGDAGAGNGGNDAIGGCTVIGAGAADVDCPSDERPQARSDPAARSDNLRMGVRFTRRRFTERHAIGSRQTLREQIETAWRRIETVREQNARAGSVTRKTQIMPRKSISRSLPPLPKTRCLDDALNKTNRLVEILRRVAVNSRSTQSRVFYSVRNISQHFHVTLSTAARAYHQLEREGLLTMVRGSKTLLQGRHYDRRLEVRAFVGLPASLSSFVTIQAYRTFFIKIRRELRLRGFATAMVFFEKDEVETAVLSERLKIYEVDTVIWFQPPRQATKSSPWLSDYGIRLIGVAHEEFPSIPCRYQVRRDQGIADLLVQWKQRYGLDHVTLAQPAERRSSTLEESLHNTLDDLSIKSSVSVFNGKRSEDFVRALQNTTTGGIIFSSSQLASQLCFRTPDAVADLLQTHRVAFLNGPVSMPFARVPGVDVDLVVVDWQLVAEKMVDDLITQEAFQNGHTTIFEAAAKLRVPLSEFAQSI